MRRIKNKTYNNLMKVAKMIEGKGYPQNVAIHLAELKFQEFNPKGIPIETMVKNMLTHDEYIETYGHEYEIF